MFYMQMAKGNSGVLGQVAKYLEDHTVKEGPNDDHYKKNENDKKLVESR